MRVNRIAVVTVAAAAFFAGCESTSPSVFEDATVTADLAASAGDAMAQSVAEMTANEVAAAMPMVMSADGQPANATTVNRSRTCYDAAGAAVANCSPIASVRKIVTNVTIDGTRDGTRTTDRGEATWTGAVHRVMSDTIRRDFSTATPPAEVSRTHSGITTGNDTTTFTEGDFTRKASEQVRDTVKLVKFNLPRSSNPWPVSGSIVRVTTVKVTVTKGSLSESRDMTRRVTVTFPPDAQGNVVLTVNETTCNLNLVTRRVTNCHK